MAMRFHKNTVRGKYLLVRDLDARQIAVIPMFNNYKASDMLNKLGFSYLILGFLSQKFAYIKSNT